MCFVVTNHFEFEGFASYEKLLVSWLCTCISLLCLIGIVVLHDVTYWSTFTEYVDKVQDILELCNAVSISNNILTQCLSVYWFLVICACVCFLELHVCVKKKVTCIVIFTHFIVWTPLYVSVSKRNCTQSWKMSVCCEHL